MTSWCKQYDWPIAAHDKLCIASCHMCTTENPFTNDTDISQNRQLYSAESLKSSVRNRRVVRGFRLVERPPIETRNSFEPRRMDDDDLQGARGKPSTIGKRPASSPAQDGKEMTNHMYQENGFGTISEHVETDFHFLEMEADTTDSISDDMQILPSETDTQVLLETSNAVNGQLIVNAEIHVDLKAKFRFLNFILLCQIMTLYIGFQNRKSIVWILWRYLITNWCVNTENILLKSNRVALWWLIKATLIDTLPYLENNSKLVLWFKLADSLTECVYTAWEFWICSWKPVWWNWRKVAAVLLHLHFCAAARGF